MAADDIVDQEALIFTEADVYMICGFLAGEWGVDGSGAEHAEDVERAITEVLSGAFSG